MLDLWELASIASKLAIYLGVLTSVGTVFAAILFRLSNFHGFTSGFAFLGIAAAAIGFLLAGAALTGDVSGMTEPEILTLLWSTTVGTSLVLRLVGLGLLIFGLFIGRIGMVMSLIGGGLALWSFVNIGHISDRSSPMLNIILMFHLVAISTWIGVLSPLSKLSRDATKILETAELGHNFGKVAVVFIPLLIIAGGYMGYVLVGSLSALFTTAYGQALILKTLSVAGLLSFAAINKIRIIPQIASGDQTATGRLAKSISYEWIVIIAILLITAILTTTLTLPA